MTHVNQQLFGMDGVRGIANTNSMEPELALKLGKAVANTFVNGSHRHRIVIGKDTRISGYMLETALASGICSMGADVMLVGPLPTPGIAFIAKSMRADAGIVISASHNEYISNGIKIFDREGFKLSNDNERTIENLVYTNLAGVKRPIGEDIGKALRINDAQGRYIQFLKEVFPCSQTLEGLRIVVDCANGAGYRVAPTVFQELGAEVIELGTQPDGKNINAGCGSLHPEKMCDLVMKLKANAGVALDGDADRVIMCDDKGNIVDGDVIMALAALDLKRCGNLNNNSIVATIMSNMALDAAMKDHDINVVRTRVGDRYVIAAMRECGYNLGGEQSGHFIFMDHNTTGDGILGALKVFAAMISSGKPLSELAHIFDPYPQVKVDVNVLQKCNLSSIPGLNNAMRSFENELGTSGRLVVRYSGTENVARVLVEGPNHEQIKNMANELADIISDHSQ